MEGLSLKAWHKLVEILLSKDPINLPPEITKVYINPDIGHICGCTDLEKYCTNKITLRNCARCGNTTAENNIYFRDGNRYYFHWCHLCKCKNHWCSYQNLIYNKKCLNCLYELQEDLWSYDPYCEIERLLEYGLLDYNKIKRLAIKNDDNRLIEYFKNH